MDEDFSKKNKLQYNVTASRVQSVFAQSIDQLSFLLSNNCVQLRQRAYAISQQWYHVQFVLTYEAKCNAVVTSMHRTIHINMFGQYVLVQPRSGI